MGQKSTQAIDGLKQNIIVRRQKKRLEPSVPGLRAWSPTALLARLDGAWLPRADERGYVYPWYDRRHQLEHTCSYRYHYVHTDIWHAVPSFPFILIVIHIQSTSLITYYNHYFTLILSVTNTFIHFHAWHTRYTSVNTHTESYISYFLHHSSHLQLLQYVP